MIKSSDFLRGRLKLFIARHAVRFAQRNRRDAMTVQPDALVGGALLPMVEVATWSLMVHQPPQSARHFFPVFAIEVIVTGTQEGEQREPCCGRIGANQGRRAGRVTTALEGPAPIVLLY